jgi:hypothetical protein
MNINRSAFMSRIRSMLLVALALAAADSSTVSAQQAALASSAGDGPIRRPSFESADLRLAPTASPPRATAAPVTVAVPADHPRLYYSAPLAAFFGVAGMVGGYGLGLGAFGCEDESPGCEHGPDDFEYALGWGGLALGSAFGAHLGGFTHRSQGSFWASLGAAAVGALPLLLMPKDDDQTGMWIAGMVAAPAGAVAADYLVRSPR